jgi:deoxyribodipyrimidine photo-lyase
VTRVNQKRIELLKEGKQIKGPVVYWMQRDQRADDNWALLYAQDIAKEKGVLLYVVFCLTPSFNNASVRHYAFMLAGLRKVENELLRYNIPFVLLSGNPEKEISEFIKSISAGVLVTDFNPLKNITRWKLGVKEKVEVPFYEVDTHNIVPCRAASQKQEFGAYTIRPRINKLLEEFLEEFPPLKKMKPASEKIINNWDKAIVGLKADKPVDVVSPIKPGADEALKTLQKFLDSKFPGYNENRNDPSLDFTSGLSPYFHFGQIAPQRAALVVQRLIDNREAQSAFLEELIIRRELADNYCFYNTGYDSFAGFPLWAKDTLNAHRKDKREFIYSVEELECSKTHDQLWNAAQKEMVIKGKMHGYLRMYWAKKILEWSKTPEEAITSAIYLNDKYELDGRDSNGYTGIAWAIGGVHDRAWGERPVFGKIRYMNFNGCRRKFDVDLYVDKINSLDK